MKETDSDPRSRYERTQDRLSKEAVNAPLRDETQVTTTGIVGTDFVVFGAWEPFDGHWSSRPIADRSMGRIGTRRLPAELDALEAGSDDRAERIRRWYEDQYAEAYGIIRDAVDPAGWDRSLETGGEIEVYMREPTAQDDKVRRGLAWLGAA